MPIQIKGTGPGRRQAPGGRGRWPRWLVVVAVGQLAVTLPTLAFLVLMLENFRYQAPPLEKLGYYVLLTEMAESLRAYRFPVRHWLGLDDEFPTLYLDVKQKDYRELEYVWKHDLSALDAGAAGQSLRRDVSVPAQLRLEGKSIPAKIRLKGDRTVHFSDPARWSFRVETRGEHTIFGLKRFSLQKPVVRNYVYEWFFHRVLRREGLIGLRYRFLDLYVNGKPQGIYALEEHFEKRLLEANDRREAPILKFSEEITASWSTMAVEPYSAKRWSERDPQILQQAVYLLEGFRDGRLGISEAFDIELLARYFALCDLLEAFHAALAKSIKFYYNPITAKLEPIGFDAQFAGRKFPVLTSELSDFRRPSGYSMPVWYEALFGPDIYDKLEFYEAYVRELERISEPAFLDELFAEIDPELERNLDFIYSEIPFVSVIAGHPRTTGAQFLFYFAKQKYYERQHFIRQRVRPQAALTAYVTSSSAERIALELGNAQKLPLEVLEVVHEGRIYRPSERLLLNEKPRYEPLSYQQVELQAVGDAPPPPPKRKDTVLPKALRSFVRYRVPGSNWVGERELFRWTLAAPPMPEPSRFNRFVDVPARPFLAVDAAGRVLKVRDGLWTLDEDLVVPGGWKLVGGPGTVLDLRRGARIVSYSPLEITGSEIAPFVLTSSDATGRGLVVIDAGAPSALRHVVFDQLVLPADSEWKITSVVTFYRSDVGFDDCTFRANRSEDALNVVRSNFAIRTSRFERTSGDAFDSDFSDGAIDESHFAEIGNDAVDASGSQVTLRHVQIEGAGDKGLSVGEGSRVDAEVVLVSGAKIAVAVKDSSSFEGQTLDLRDSEVGIAVFQKKSEFGPASAQVWRTVFSGVKETHWLERDSQLHYDGSPVASNKANLRDMIYAEEETGARP